MDLNAPYRLPPDWVGSGVLRFFSVQEDGWQVERLRAWLELRALSSAGAHRSPRGWHQAGGRRSALSGAVSSDGGIEENGADDPPLPVRLGSDPVRTA